MPEHGTLLRAKLSRRTLRGRVSFVGSLIIAAWLLVLTVGFNLVLMNQLNRQTNDTLRTNARNVAATITITNAGRVSVEEDTADAAIDTGIWVYAGTNTIERPPGGDAAQKFADSLVNKGELIIDNDQARYFSLPLYSHNHQVATVITSTDLRPYQRAERLALIGSGALCVLALAGAYPVLRTATRRALRPVETMTQQAAEWSASAFSKRFGSEHRFAELQSLAHSLDDVLDHLSAVVRHERQLSAELSHELRTPLARITAETDLLLTRPHKAEQTHAAHRAIHEAARSLERILDTLLSAGRSEKNSAPGRCNLQTVLNELVRTFHLPSDGSTITVRADELYVGIEARMVERILSPVVENAVRYARNAVLINAYRATKWIFVDVTTDGPGLNPDLKNTVFEPGFRGDPTDGHNGHGLGLTLARRLARAADGDITALTQPSTIFRIKLPPG